MTYVSEKNGHSATVHLSELHADIQHKLPNTKVEQIDHLVKLIEIQQGLQTFAEAHSTDVKPFELTLDHIQKDLNYEEPFRVAVVALTGTGKSTLLNALLARPLVLVKGTGGAATGCALQIFQDVPPDGVEVAVVEYRNEENIRALIEQYFIQHYKLDHISLTGSLDEGFASALSNLEPPTLLSEDERREFEDLRSTLADIVKQYARNPYHQLKSEFILNRQADVDAILDLTNEESRVNQSGGRRIGLVKTVNYHIRPDTSQAFHLPQNVCLVDLPGLDGTCLHNIIIREGIKNADAVLFVVHPRRFKTLRNTDLLRRVRRHISVESDPRSAERIFMVVNAKDEINTDLQQAIYSINQDLDQYIEELIPGGSQSCPRFLISAWAALQAQQVLRGEVLDNPTKYESVKLALGIQNGNDHDVLLASEVPALVQKLTGFIKSRVERQIREAHQALEHIITTLMNEYIEEQQKSMEETNPSNPQQQLNCVLAEQLKQLENLVKEVRRTQLNRLPDVQQQLQQVATVLCNDIDDILKAEMPDYWKMHFADSDYPPQSILFARVIKEGFLGQVEINLWEQIAAKVPRLAQEMVHIYKRLLESFELSSRIAERCFEQIEPEAVATKLEAGIQRMQENLIPAVKGLALAQVVDPRHNFITFSEDGTEQPSFLLSQIKTMPLERELRDVAFNEFTQAMRQHYQPFVYEDCVSGLLNLYRYEMLRCERRLILYLRSRFEEIRHTIDPSLLAEMIKDSPNIELQHLAELEHKLNTLRSLKERLAFAHIV